MSACLPPKSRYSAPAVAGRLKALFVGEGMVPYDVVLPFTLLLYATGSTEEAPSKALPAMPLRLPQSKALRNALTGKKEAVLSHKQYVYKNTRLVGSRLNLSSQVLCCRHVSLLGMCGRK